MQPVRPVRRLARRLTRLAVGLLALPLAACQVDALAGVDPEGTPYPVLPGPGASIAAEPLPVCAPQPVAWAPPDLTDEPGVLSGACRLQSVAADQGADGKAVTTVQYVHGPQTVTVQQPGPVGQPGASMVYTLDDAGRVTSRHNLDAKGNLKYADVRTFDADGHLTVHETVVMAGSTQKIGQIHRVEQTWTDGRLLQRRESNLAGETARTTWRYDAAGRMLEAVRRIGPQQKLAARATWSYDAAGRPISLQRETQGQLAMRATWAWADTGRLARRTIEVRFGAKGYGGGKLDSYDAPTGSTSGTCYGCGFGGGEPGSQPWLDALATERDGCRTLPTAVGHGYPEADYAVEDGLGGAYGYGYYGYGYGYGYGSSGGGFQGHGGVGSNWDALAVHVPHSAARFDLRYDAAGRMVQEVLEVDATGPAAKAPRFLMRVREFGADGLRSDRVLHGAREVRALRFGRDDQGHMVRRDLLVAAQLAETEAWHLDAQGRVLELVRTTQKAAYKVLAPQLLSPEVPPPDQVSRWLRAYDAAGRVVDEQVVLPGSAGVQLHRTRAYDAAGRLVAQTTAEGTTTPQTVETWAFDAAGRETLHTVRYPAAATIDWYQTQSYNAAGLTVAREQGHDPATGPTWRETRTYACP